MYDIHCVFFIPNGYSLYKVAGRGQLLIASLCSRYKGFTFSQYGQGGCNLPSIDLHFNSYCIYCSESVMLMLSYWHDACLLTSSKICLTYSTSMGIATNTDCILCQKACSRGLYKSEHGTKRFSWRKCVQLWVFVQMKTCTVTFFNVT